MKRWLTFDIESAVLGGQLVELLHKRNKENVRIAGLTEARCKDSGCNASGAYFIL